MRNPRTGLITGSIDPNELFDAIVSSAWQTEEPGLLFLDEINRQNPSPTLRAIEATNPCEEKPLLPYESCTLGSLNLKAFAADENGLDWPRLREAVVFLDNVLEVNSYPTAEIADATRRTRKIGLGVMGFADLLAMDNIPYDSVEAVQLAGEDRRVHCGDRTWDVGRAGGEARVLSAFDSSV